MEILVNDVNINYELYGNNKKETIVLLHGWGQNIDMMKPLGNYLSDDYQILIVDLPGFGNSEEPKYPWSLLDYVKSIREIVLKEKIDKPIMMGHSFGGKLALLYASIYDVSKLVVFASPINHNHQVSLKSKVLKGIKKLPMMDKLGEKMKKHMGSTDYRQASPVMREILVNHLSTDIYDDLSNIKASTLIVWGEQDVTVSPNVAYEIDERINDSGVVILPGTHYAYLENLNRVVEILTRFLEAK